MTPKQKKYLQWLTTPDSERDPQTEEELATHLKCKPSTLQRWVRQPEFQEAFDLEIHHNLTLKIWSLYQVLAEKALEGDFRSLKIILEILRHYPIPKDSDQSIEKPPIVYTVEDYAKADKLYRELDHQATCDLDPSIWS